MNGCGLRHAGAPEPEEGMRVDGPLGLHGRLSNTPAESVPVHQGWVDGKYVLSVTGTVREVAGETVPPAPDVMVTVAESAKLAVTAVSAVMAGTVHGLAEPVHAPVQPVNMLPAAAVADDDAALR